MSAVPKSTFEASEFRWVESGNPAGPAMVLVHGYMAHSMAYRRVADALGAQHRLLIVDLPAHGRDESYRRADVQPTIESLARWMGQFRDVVLGDEPAHWLGHSLGANLAYRVASADPKHCLSLTMVSAGVRVPAQPLVARALKRLPAGLATLGANRLGLALYQPLNWRGTAMTRAEEEEYLAPLRSKRRMEFILQLGARIVDGRHTDIEPLDVPTLVIWGEHDHILPLEDAWWLGERLSADVHVIEGSGHAPMEDTPTEFVRIIADWQARTGG